MFAFGFQEVFIIVFLFGLTFLEVAMFVHAARRKRWYWLLLMLLFHVVAVVAYFITQYTRRQATPADE